MVELSYDRGDNFFGRRWLEDDFDNLMANIVEKLNQLPDDENALDVTLAELIDKPSALSSALTANIVGVAKPVAELATKAWAASDAYVDFTIQPDGAPATKLDTGQTVDYVLQNFGGAGAGYPPLVLKATPL